MIATVSLHDSILTVIGKLRRVLTEKMNILEEATCLRQVRPDHKHGEIALDTNASHPKSTSLPNPSNS